MTDGALSREWLMWEPTGSGGGYLVDQRPEGRQARPKGSTVEQAAGRKGKVKLTQSRSLRTVLLTVQCARDNHQENF